jgi:hypothetical protein
VTWNTRYWLKEQVFSGQIAQNRSPAGSFAIDDRKRSLLCTFSCENRMLLSYSVFDGRGLRDRHPGSLITDRNECAFNF